MNKEDIINGLIKKKKYRSYLEVGVEYGYCFLRIKCKNKIAVDPNFKISTYYKFKQVIKFPYNLKNKYFKDNSDLFFEKKAPALFKTKKVDCVLIDGLHTFRQSLKDILNSLKHLSENGTIIVHDCFPPHDAAATPASSIDEARKMDIADWDDLWCGDVWKSMVYLINQYPNELEVVTLSSDFGVGVVKVKKMPNSLIINEFQFEKTNNFTFDYLLANTHLINLIPPTKFNY